MKLSTEAKHDWLYKALNGIPKGYADKDEIFHIISHPKFASGVTEWHIT